jgi:RNA polymerase sigma factor (sigma-70 family)
MSERPNQTVRIQGWIDRLQQGDESARNELINLACERLTRLTRKMLKGYPRVKRWEETGDVVQNAAIRLYRSLGEVKPATVVDFFRLAALNIRRELLDLAKHYYGPRGLGAKHATIGNQADSDSSPRLGADKPASIGDDPNRLAAWAEFHRQIEHLPDEEREVFDLLWYQGLSQAEAAGVLQVSERTIKRRWQAARHALSEAMHGELPGE